MTFSNVSEARNMGLYIIHATAVALAADIWKPHPGVQRSDPLVWLAAVHMQDGPAGQSAALRTDHPYNKDFL
jgi:hypothetical protein